MVKPPVPPKRCSSQNSTNYSYHEVDKFLSNPRNTDFTHAAALLSRDTNGIHCDRELIDATNALERLPSPGTLYGNGKLQHQQSPPYYEEDKATTSPTHGRNSSRSSYYRSSVKTKKSQELPASPPAEQREFNRPDKTRKSTIRQTLSSFWRRLKPKSNQHHHYHKDDSSLYITSKSISTHTMNRAGSVKGNNTMPRNHSFSTPTRNHERTRSMNPREPYSLSLRERDSSAGPESHAPQPRSLETRNSISPITPNVPPARKPHIFEMLQPVACTSGIPNHGNSCYMNAILQCLASVNKFAELFVCYIYNRYMNKQIPLQNGRTSEKETVELCPLVARVLQDMYFNGNVDSSVGKLFQAIPELSAQFGNAYQQDAQEFLIWLLDKIHEEIKDTACPNHTPSAIGHKRTEDELACEAMFQHQKGNCSAIMKMFCAQFRSSIECVKCQSKNLSFDPYRTISLTVPPLNNLNPFSAIWIPYLKERILNRYSIRLPTNTTLMELLNHITMQVPKLSTSKVVPVYLKSNGACQFVEPKAQIPWNAPTPLVFVGVPENGPSGDPDFIIAICSFSIGLGMDSRRHGLPFVTVLRRVATYEEILSDIQRRGQTLIEAYEPPRNIFRFCRILVGDISKGIELDSTLTYPLFSKVMEKCMQDDFGRRVPMLINVKFVATFAESFFKQQPERVSEIACVTPPSLNTVTLEHLLHEYVQPEIVEWKCTRYLDGHNTGKKQLKFHSLPPVLIFHLKRFHMEEGGSMKRVERPVTIPLEGLNMGRYVCRSDSSQRHHGSQGPLCSIDRDLSCLEQRGVRPEEQTYDLVGVVQHFGDRINSGHYTAYAKNLVDQKWRSFDDMRVSPVDPQDVTVSSNVYMMFYVRRSTIVNNNWFHRVPQFIVDRYVRQRALNESTCKLDNSHLNGVKTLPRPSFQSHIAENGLSQMNGTHHVPSGMDRSRSYQNVSGGKYGGDERRIY